MVIPSRRVRVERVGLRNHALLRCLHGRAGDQVFGSARRNYSLFVNVYFVFTNILNTGDNGNTADKEKEVLVNTNGGNTTSNSSGGPFLGYNLLTLFQLEVLLLMFIAMSTLCYYVIVDAYSTLCMLMLITFTTITGSNPIVNIMFIILLFWIKICRIMTKFPTSNWSSNLAL